MSINRRVAMAHVAGAGWLGAGIARAQAYPARPIVLVAPFAAGGVTDASARVVARRLGERLGQPIVVENRPGAGGSVATDFVAKARPDGYTLLFGSRVTQITNPLVTKARVPTDKDFAAISTVCDVAAIVVANPNRPYKSIAELVAYAKAHPDAINYATPGNGTAAHLAAAVFMDLTGTRMTHVPFKGSAPAIQDLIGGTVDIAFDYPSSTASFIKAGTLRALAALSPTRLPTLPDVPTIAEAGVPGAEMASWQAILAPGQTPPPVVDRLVAEMTKVMEEPEVKQRLTELGTVPLAVPGKALQQLIDRETVRWREVVTRARISID